MKYPFKLEFDRGASCAALFSDSNQSVTAGSTHHQHSGLFAAAPPTPSVNAPVQPVDS